MTGRNNDISSKVILRAATFTDMPFIKEHIEKFQLDDENLDFRQFVVVVEGSSIAGFGRIRPHKEVYELGAVGVVEEMRGRGIGRMIVDHLIASFPADEVFVTTAIPKYFERFGFRKIMPGPKELVEKLNRVCKSRHKGNAVVMVMERGESSGSGL